MYCVLCTYTHILYSHDFPIHFEHNILFSFAVMTRPELASYQFPVDEEEEQAARHEPKFSSKPSASALKKSGSDSQLKSKKKTPAFRDW